MQSAISTGTLLQNRYHILRLLGQGGFGRTYLAEDQGRFQEHCAIKEFVPSQGEDRFSSKATQLFQREAAILYQISHPQIPQFRATFEQDQRLFLVQDYVEGTTYRDLLNQRQGQGRTFSETEIRQFIQQLLPVLAHIHAKGIIHRDISPDNIILRRADQLPVLIDFGVVKEVVTRLQLEDANAPATTVGKIGYAPSEQMQTGRAYPSSDLYSLAVTAVVLLTGQEPQAIFDDVNLAWKWQQHAQVSPELAQVLNTALNYRPGDRFQSVSQMAQALAGQSLQPGAVGSQVPSPQTRPPQTRPPQTRPAPGNVPNNQAPQPPLSEMRTVAVGRPAPGTPSSMASSTMRQTRSSPSQSSNPGVLENPWALTVIGLGAAGFAGFGGWAVVKYFDDPNAVAPQPSITPLPTLTASPTPTPTTQPTQVPSNPAEYNLALDLTPGGSQVVEGSVNEDETVNYIISGAAGQSLFVNLIGEGVLLSVVDPNGNAPDNNANRVFRWNGELEQDGDYVVQLKTVQGLSSSDYKLEVGLAGAAAGGDNNGAEDNNGSNGPGETENGEDADNSEGGNVSGGNEGGQIPDPSSGAGASPPEVQSEVLQQRVQFPEGQTGTLLANSVGPGRIRRYVVNARQGQIITVKFTEANGPVTFDVMLPGGEPIADADNVLFWQSYLPLGGDYAIDVESSSASEFTLEIQITGQ